MNDRASVVVLKIEELSASVGPFIYRPNHLFQFGET